MDNLDRSYWEDIEHWPSAEEDAESPEDTLKLTAGALLQAARDLRDLSSGVLERRDGLDRAARVASIRSTDAFAFVASLFTDGRLGAEVEADFRKHFPDFDIDHDELIGLQDLREQMKAAIASGMVSPFVNMEEPPPARDDAAELRALLNHPLLNKLMGELEDHSSGRWWGMAEEWMDLRDAALAATEGES